MMQKYILQLDLVNSVKTVNEKQGTTRISEVHTVAYLLKARTVETEKETVNGSVAVK
jgi:hypothetical protein